jgi:hypothetical protein
MHPSESLDVATLLATALDGDTTILTTMTMVELGPKVNRSGTCRWCTRRGWRACS